MTRADVAQRIVEAAETLTSGKKFKTASGKPVAAREVAAYRLYRLAKDLTAYDVDAEFEASVQEVGNLAQQFRDTHQALIAEVGTMEKALQEKRALLASYYKGWKTQSGYEKARREMLRQAEQCMEVGDVLDDLAEDLQVVRRESTQESYKEKYNVLVSTLNEAELKKYSRILGSFFRKQTTEVKTGLKELDGAVKEWHESAQAIADERGIKLPKASELGRVRTANVLTDIAEILKGIIPNFVKGIKMWATKLWNAISKNGRELDKISSDILGMASKARAAL